MCVIVYKPEGLKIDIDILRQCWDRNKDGAGMMFAEDGRLKIAKGFMQWRSLKRYIKRFGNDRMERLPVCFHFRIATQGSVSEANCHPFTIDKNVAMMHNGIISNLDVDIDRDISDSEAFVEQYVTSFKGISIDTLDKGTPLNGLYSKFVSGSKLLFMDNKGDVAIVNEGLGYWATIQPEKGMWFSNRTWHAIRYTTPLASRLPASNAQRSAYHGDAWHHTGEHRSGAGFKHSTDRPALPEKSVLGSKLDMPEDGRGDPAVFDVDWYCMECHEYFAYRKAGSVHWTSGSRIVECCECGGINTIEASKIFNEDADNKTARPGRDVCYEDDLGTEWCCWDCGNQFEEEDSDELIVNGEDRRKCPFCQGDSTYESHYQDLVDTYGDMFFDPPSTYASKGRDKDEDEEKEVN